MHGKGHDAGGQDIVLHPSIPCRPESLCHIQLSIVFRDLVELAPVGARGQHSGIPRETSAMGTWEHRRGGGRAKCTLCLSQGTEIVKREKRREENSGEGRESVREGTKFKRSLYEEEVFKNYYVGKKKSRDQPIPKWRDHQVELPLIEPTPDLGGD